MDSNPQPLRKLAVLPEPGDNAAVAAADIPAGTGILMPDGSVITLPHRVMEGHRFVTEAIPAGGELLSWNRAFATATRNLVAGDYVCTTGSLSAMRGRGVEGLPPEPSAENVPLVPFVLDESVVDTSPQVSSPEPHRTFRGYLRKGGGAGTRNHIVVVGITSRSAAFAEALAGRFQGETSDTFDGVVAVAHTEAGEADAPNNRGFVVSTLAGYITHPNIGALLLIDEQESALHAPELIEAAQHRAGQTPVSVLKTFTRSGSFADDLQAAEQIVRDWIPGISNIERTDVPCSKLNIALQCGGSDAFSGISANPLNGKVAAEVIRNGGTAVLAETDELIGAEDYVLSKVASVDVARKFLDTVEAFKQRVAWSGYTAEGNPSGGNLYRGLYNITLKSLGAARKLAPEVRLDHVVGYGEPCPGTGYVFMDSPGNDLESIAGQVATGCNLIYFTTGNGSITNFPFVPTIKFVTSTERYKLLSREMDVNAGAYLDGLSMEDLTQEVFELSLAVASGQRTDGEKAAHSQVSLWRNWKQGAPVAGLSIRTTDHDARDPHQVPDDLADRELPGQPLMAAPGQAMDAPGVSLYHADGRASAERIVLIMPTSLCSAQVSRLIADEATRQDWLHGRADRVVSLPHSEGCGVSSGPNIETFSRVVVGSLLHPNVAAALLLEHGCEKTHNDFFRAAIRGEGGNPRRFGWASIQLDGGIESVKEKIHDWLDEQADQLATWKRAQAPLGELCIAFDATGEVSGADAEALAWVGAAVVAAGGSVIIAQNSPLLKSREFTSTAFAADTKVEPTIAHGQRPVVAGWHVMRDVTQDSNETIAGLVASGAMQVLVLTGGHGVSGHRLVPVLQVASDPDVIRARGADLDAQLTGDSSMRAEALLGLVTAVANGDHVAQTVVDHNVTFQVTRGLVGTSM